MENPKDKIPSPFRAPDGYFDLFESRLNEKINAPAEQGMKITSRRYPVLDYVAVAATLAAIMVTGWFVVFRTEPADVSAVATQTPKTRPADTTEILIEPVESAEVLADKVAADILESTEVESTNYTVKNTIAASDVAIATELDAAGLIVMDVDDGLFDAFEL